MFDLLKRLLFGTLRRQLIIGMAIIVALMMSLFVWDQTRRFQNVLMEQQSDQALALARSVAMSSAIWVSSRDYTGLQEVIEGISQFSDLKYAIVVDSKGMVLAHSDQTRRGMYLTDLPQEAKPVVSQRGANLVDVASPIILTGNNIGWVRIGLGSNVLGAKLASVTQAGIIYALAAIVLSTLLAALTGRYLTRRLYAIQKVVNAVQSGKTKLRAVILGDDEAAQLAHQFNGMLDTLSLREHALVESESRLQQLNVSLEEQVMKRTADLAGKNRLFEVIEQMQDKFINESDHLVMFDSLLQNIITLTGSQYGLVGEVLQNEDGVDSLKSMLLPISHGTRKRDASTRRTRPRVLSSISWTICSAVS